MFQAIKTMGRTSKAPITESFGGLAKWQTLLMVLWGATAGQAVVWYTGQFYALSWLQGKGTANVPFVDSYVIMAIALALATPFFIVFGALSDRIGRKPVMMAGNLLGAVLTLPLFYIMHRFTPVSNNYQPVLITVCVFVLVLLVTMVYGPIAAFLVESFPSKVRYTSVSLPYHIGNGYFGGFLPLIATALVATATRSSSASWKAWAPYVGLAFPIAVAAVTFVVGSLLLRETKDNAMEDEQIAQRGFSWPVFVGLVALSAVALVLADQFLTPTLNSPNFNVQWFFRLLALVVAVISIGYALMRRARREAITPAPPQPAGDA